MPADSKRGLVAPQNTFLESIIRKTNQNENQYNFLLANAQLYNWPIVYVNEGFCQVTGISRPEMMTCPCVCELMHGHLTSVDTIALMREALEHHNQAKFELLLYDRRGTPLWFLIQIAPIKNDLDCTVLFLLTFKDISVSKKPIHASGMKIGGNRFTNFVKSLQQHKEGLEEHIEASVQQTSDRKNKSNELFTMNPNMLPRYQHKAPKTPKYIILHYSVFKTSWNWLILILTLYTAIFVPYNVAFQVSKARDGSVQGKSPAWLLSDSAVDIIFLLDIIIYFHTTYVGPGGEVISDPKVIRMTYIRGWFFIDLISCLPYDLVNFLFSNSSGSGDEGISSLFSSLKIARLLRLGRVARKLDHFIEYGGAMLVVLVCFFGLSGHWLACIWYTIGASDMVRNGTIVGHNWLVLHASATGKDFYLNEDGLIDGGPTQPECYIAALYFTMTSLTSVGYGNVAAFTANEQLFCIIMLLFGALLYATIFGNMTSIIQQMYRATNRYHDMLNMVREFLKLYQIPEGLGDRIMDYIVSTWSMSKGIDSNKVLNYCPKDMKADICVHLNRKVFNKHPAFRLASDSCLRAFAIEFTDTHNAPGDIIYHKGESVDALNFVVSGSLEVIQNDEVIAILSKGDVFGDTFWKNENIGQSASHVRALTYCDIHSISSDALLRILKFYQSFALSFTKKMILTFNLRKRFLFRKISDIQKEREEILRRQSDTNWEGNFPEQHPIRQLFRRFKKTQRQRPVTSPGILDGSSESNITHRQVRLCRSSRVSPDINLEAQSKCPYPFLHDDRPLTPPSAEDTSRTQSYCDPCLSVDIDSIILSVDKAKKDLETIVQNLGDRMLRMENHLSELTKMITLQQQQNQNYNNNANLDRQTGKRTKEIEETSFSRSSNLVESTVKSIKTSKSSISSSLTLHVSQLPSSSGTAAINQNTSKKRETSKHSRSSTYSQRSVLSGVVLVDLENTAQLSDYG